MSTQFVFENEGMLKDKTKMTIFLTPRSAPSGVKHSSRRGGVSRSRPTMSCVLVCAKVCRRKDAPYLHSRWILLVVVVVVLFYTLLNFLCCCKKIYKCFVDRKHILWCTGAKYIYISVGYTSLRHRYLNTIFLDYCHYRNQVRIFFKI